MLGIIPSRAAARGARATSVLALAFLPMMFASCGGDSTTDTEDGVIEVEVQLDGNATSSERATVRWVSGTVAGTRQPVELGGAVSLPVPDPGTYAVELSELADHCYSEEPEASATVGEGTPGSAVFTVVCVGDFVYTSLGGARLSYQATDGTRVHDEQGSDIRVPVGWSPSGRFFLYRSDSSSGCQVRVFDVETGTGDRVGARRRTATWRGGLRPEIAS